VGGCGARPAAPAAPVAVLPCFSGLGVANRLCLHAPGGRPCAACPLAPELARVLASPPSLRLGGPCGLTLQNVAGSSRCAWSACSGLTRAPCTLHSALSRLLASSDAVCAAGSWRGEQHPQLPAERGKGVCHAPPHARCEAEPASRPAQGARARPGHAGAAARPHNHHKGGTSGPLSACARPGLAGALPCPPSHHSRAAHTPHPLASAAALPSPWGVPSSCSALLNVAGCCCDLTIHAQSCPAAVCSLSQLCLAVVLGAWHAHVFTAELMLSLSLAGGGRPAPVGVCARPGVACTGRLCCGEPPSGD
jgi:hypothetical protein